MHSLECVLFPRRIYNEICDIDFISLFINIYTKDAASFVHGFPAILYIDKNIWIGIIASVVAVITALNKLPVIGVVLVSVISCVILYMFILS